ncbi:tyrosine-type recombinase/integrase [Pseudooceanicola sp. 200-1SW]|uniref:tyrosine-type recombinase/integrase n=1 Tax=Pseudooceanicola sp. 200-1SW TaxID=3425949 RepID=UPI003D7F69D8
MKVKFPGYVPEKMKSGEWRHRVRVEGNPRKRIRIPVGPDEAAFTEHYYAARAGQTVEEKPLKPVVRHSLDELARDYLIWLEAQVQAGNASPMTLKQRRSLFGKVCEMKDPEGERMGDLHHDLPPTGIHHIIDQWGEATAQADNSRKALSAAYKWAITRGRATRNPCTGIARVHRSRGGAVPWSSSDVRAFLDAHPEGTTARRWLLLAMFTACRISDARTLGRQHEVTRDGVVFLDWQPQKKGSAFVSVPIAPQLLAELRATETEGPTYILSEHGRPYRSTAALHQRIRRWVDVAGLENRSQHGLRKAMGEILAEAGATQHQIMAVMAHTQPATSAIYTHRADRRRMASAAMEAIKGFAL